tara:strand:- start:136 stop:447 length:312 start_codon:yes stop_codon:yes gene_type:complete
MKYDTISEKLNQVWMEGFGEEEYGSCQEEGFSAALIITDKMIYCDELGNQLDEVDAKPLIGIIEETDQGFVDYELFPTEIAARGRWEDHVDMWERLYHPESRG